MNYLNSKQVDKFHRDGFLIINNTFTKEECDELKKTLIVEIKKGKNILEKSPTKSNDKINYDKVADVPRKINEGLLQDIANRNSKFMSLAKDNRLVSIISQLFGNDIKTYCLYRSTCIFKNSKISSATSWHQDIIYWKGRPNKLSIWISLDKVTKQSGSMHYIPGSHSELYNDILKNGHDRKSIEDYWKSSGENVDESKKVIAELEKGDIVIHHCCVMHGSEPNSLAKERYALIFTYQPSSDNSHHRGGPPEIIKKL